jgi:flagellar protein FliS
MSLQNPYMQYRQTQANTASQFKLIIMLHDRVIRALQQAIIATRSKDFEEMSAHYNKATEVISHLASSLQMDTGEIAENLGRIYLYCLRAIVEANAKEDAKKAQEVIGHIRAIRNAWCESEAGKEALSGSSAPATELSAAV